MSPISESIAQAVAAFDLRHLPPEFYTDPFPYYRALREREPVKRLPDGSVLLTRYADCEYVYKNPALFSSDKKTEYKPKYGDSLLYEHHTTSLVFNDPPLHTRVRRLIIGALTPKAIAEMQPGLEALVERLLDRMAEAGDVDLIENFAAAIPIEIVGNLLGVPKDEREPLRAWSLAILGALEPVVPPEVAARGNKAVKDFLAYLETLVARRRQKPGNPERDVLTRLIQGEGNGEENGERLTEKELLHNCIFLLNAGHETTTNLIGNSVDILIRNPEALCDLATHPDTIDTAVEEFLRMESSNQLGNRRAAVDTRLGGVAMPAGTYVHLCIGAANRDPDQFPDPDRCDIRRHPNRHLAFGFGIHTCAGNSLARMEAQVAIGKLVPRFKSIERAGPPTRGGRARFRGFAHYPIAVRA